jgi:nucleotide-binding universal stress UspA family protein
MHRRPGLTLWATGIGLHGSKALVGADPFLVLRRASPTYGQNMEAPVVVGVDGSPSALSAVTLAAQQAARLGVPLHVVHAFIWPLMRVPLGPSPAGPLEGGLRHDAERLLAEAVEVARKAADVRVTSDLVVGGAAAVMLDEARRARLVVVGHRGLGGFAGLLLGSVAAHLATHSPIAVLVARGVEHSGGPVLVGVDGSPESDGAVEAAFREAEQRRAGLLAVHTWTGPISRQPGDMLPLVYDRDLVEQEETRVLGEAIAGHRANHPDVVVEERVVCGRAAHTLIELSEDAPLLVIGSRGRGGFARLMLGSTSQQVFHHAHCPVLLIPRPNRA